MIRVCGEIHLDNSGSSSKFYPVIEDDLLAISLAFMFYKVTGLDGCPPEPEANSNRRCRGRAR